MNPSFTISEEETLARVELHNDKIDHVYVNQLINEVLVVLGKSNITAVSFNMKKISFISSIGIGAILTILQNAGKANKSFYLENVPNELKKTLAIMHLDTVLDIK